MSRIDSPTTLTPVPGRDARPASPPPTLAECLRRLGVVRGRPETLPFAAGDATAGSETELQAAVIGHADEVDLPLTITASNYYANLRRRTTAGDASPRMLTAMERYLRDNPENVWENSWVRFPCRRLSPFAQRVLDEDLRADKSDPGAGSRADCHRFCFRHQGEEYLRIPISYLVKLALADSLAVTGALPEPVLQTGVRLLEHFLSDNTSPETYSFHVTHTSDGTGSGRALAGETATRYLFTQLLIRYANQRFGLAASGQQATIFFSPHPPIRQKQLNECIPDSFYRELFMSPCLSGWARGENKHRYMALCHQVLSRSHLNAVGKLREAGILVNNLMVLPNTSNISLANNGVHVSFGSWKLAALQADPASGFDAGHEKFLGDLAIKIVEHFLPLFVGTYSAAPYRIDFMDFHPERVLGFLPHELDYTHLRMLWRRWKKKARNRLCGHAATPFGPPLFDRLLAYTCRLKGDFVQDFRLIDYLAALMSTEKSPALDGTLGNDARLRTDLDHMGVFDSRMSLYQLLKIREFQAMGFSGFEARYFSLFPSLARDLAAATDLQQLLLALAFKYMVEGRCDKGHIPDTPFVESERRQIFFGAAIGLPTFFVRQNTPNLFLRRILGRTRQTRPSRRYPGYLRVPVAEYRLALVHLIREDGADLVEMTGLDGMLDDLAQRLAEPDRAGAGGRLVRAILGAGRSPLEVSGQEFNPAAERYYRQGLRQRHTREAIAFLVEECRLLEKALNEAPLLRSALREILGDRPLREFVAAAGRQLEEETLDFRDLVRLIHLMLAVEAHQTGATVTAPSAAMAIAAA